MESTPSLPVASPREPLIRRARFLARLGLAWHAIEAASRVAIGAGVAASSIALIGFGADSLVESMAGVVLLWRLGERRAQSEEAERRAQRLIGLTFWLIASYIGIEGGGERRQPGSAATRSEGRQNLLCGDLSAALLVGLGANAAFGWWWADPSDRALLIAGIAINEGREAWRGEGCADDCC